MPWTLKKAMKRFHLRRRKAREPTQLRLRRVQLCTNGVAGQIGQAPHRSDLTAHCRCAWVPVSVSVGVGMGLHVEGPAIDFRIPPDDVCVGVVPARPPAAFTVIARAPSKWQQPSAK